MNKKDNIEELIRQKLGEKDFPYDDSYWAGARETIAADGRRRRRMLFWLLIGLLALIALGLWGWPILTTETQPDTLHAHKENAEGKPSATQDHIKLWNTSVDDSTQTNKLFITRNASEAPLAGASNEASSEKELVSGSPSTAKTEILHGADFQQSAVSDSRPPDGNTDLAFTDGKQASERSRQTGTERKRSGGSSDTGFFSEKTSSLSLFSTLQISSPYLSAEEALPPLQGIRRPDKPAKRPDWLFQLGGGGALGLNGQHHRYLEAGLAARFYLQPRLHLLGGASYWLRLNKDQLATRSITNYDYTSRTTEYRLDVHQMHYLEFWAGLEYQASPRLAVLAGLSHARLLSNLATYQVNEHYRNQVEQVQHRKSMGFREGFNRQDWRIRAGLSYRLNALSELAVEMRIGLTDITHNEHFDATQRDENTFAGVTLRYKIDRR